MSDDWRVTAELSGGGSGGEIADALRDRGVGDEAGRNPGRGVAISHDRHVVHLYADTAERIEAARAALEDEVGRRGDRATIAVQRWHPDEERWEDISVPLPASPAERQAEHERLEADEAAQAAITGEADWEVDIRLPHRDEAIALAGRLEDEGLPVRRWWRVVRVGAATEDDAAALAERLRAEAPADAEIEAQGAASDAWSVLHPFPEFGGLGN